MAEHQHSWAFEPRHNRDTSKAEGVIYACWCGAHLHRYSDGTEAVQEAFAFGTWHYRREWQAR